MATIKEWLGAHAILDRDDPLTLEEYRESIIEMEVAPHRDRVKKELLESLLDENCTSGGSR